MDVLVDGSGGLDDRGDAGLVDAGRWRPLGGPAGAADGTGGQAGRPAWRIFFPENPEKGGP